MSRTLQIANGLTLARLIATPVLIGLLLDTSPEAPNWQALALIALLQSSDILDGYLARRAVTKSALTHNPVGEVLDPLADKIYINSAYVTLLSIGQAPLWAGGLIVARDIMILAGWSACYRLTGARLKPSRLGKAADSSQAILLIVILLSPAALVLHTALAITAGLTVVSGIGYARMAVQHCRRSPSQSILRAHRSPTAHPSKAGSTN